MKNIFEEALELQAFLEEKGFKFCFIGGIALQRWGELRTTNDIDLTIFTGYKDEEKYISEMVARYEARITDAVNFALTARVLLLRSGSGTGLDIALGGMPFEESTIMRSSKGEFLPGILLRTCSAEDLVVHKAFAARPKDWLDIEGIVIRQKQLDWLYIERQLKPLLELKEEPGNWEILGKIRNNNECR